jgi:hypothetical protein
LHPSNLRGETMAGYATKTAVLNLYVEAGDATGHNFSGSVQLQLQSVFPGDPNQVSS